MPGLPKNGYTAQGPLRAEVLVGLLGAPRAGRVFTVIPPFRKEQMMCVLLLHPNSRSVKTYNREFNLTNTIFAPFGSIGLQSQYKSPERI